MADEILNTAATPEQIAAQAEAAVLGGGAGGAATDEGVTPGVLEDLDNSRISATVGPGALSQPLGPAAAREAAKVFPNAPVPITPSEAALVASVDGLDQQEAALRAVAGDLGQAEGGAIGQYYGDLRTGQVVAGAQIPEDSRIGPFRTPEIARAELANAVNCYRNPA